jgi:hypothetical protein
VRVSTTTPPAQTTQRASKISWQSWPYWLLVIARAIPAIVIAAVITFSADHSIVFGLTVFAAFAVSSGIIVATAGPRALYSRWFVVVAVIQGSVGIAAGVVAGALAVWWPETTVGNFILLVLSYAAITGLLELYAGLRSRGLFVASRDWVFAGTITALFAVSLVLIPLELRIPVRGQHGIEGFLTAPIVAVGLLGAYCALIAVYLVIAGLSLKWAPTTNAAVAAERVN